MTTTNAETHDIRKDFQLISDYINSKIHKEGTRPKHDEISSEDAALFQAGLHVAFSLVSSLARIAAALEGIEMNTRKGGLLK